MRHKPQDRLEIARRHVAQAEAEVARQDARVVKLSNDNRYVELAAQARAILSTLTHSLRLAREQLARELKNQPRPRICQPLF